MTTNRNKGEFVALTAMLVDSFDKPLTDLPNQLRRRIEREFPVPWGDLDAEQRRRIAAQWDYQNDPALEDERDELFNLYAREVDIRRDMREVDLLPETSSSERESRGRQLEGLRKQLDIVRKEIGEPEATDTETVYDTTRPTGIDRRRVMAAFPVQDEPADNKRYWDDKLGRPPSWLKGARMNRPGIPGGSNL
jgi:hypothetical protein